ncbi:MAG TPA: glycosyltransferase family 4 protein [Blastocatellia bacterium]|nr:glycosyltransferase family 4 protein [Blastocatellia bacterium]
MAEQTDRRDHPLRVGIVVATPEIIGGHAVQAMRLMDGLSREPGLAARLIPINPRLPRPLRWLQRIRYLRTLVNELVYLVSLLVLLPRCDVVHIFSAAYLSFLLAPAPAVILAKLLGKGVLLNYHSGEAEDHLRRWRRTALPFIRMADLIVVPSPWLVEVFARFGVQAVAISNTVELQRFSFRPRRPLRPVLLSNRNFESHYNVAGVLRAFALVQRQVPEARLIMAGDGSERARLHALARELKLERVEFTGAVAPAQMPRLYEQADIFINASEVDNTPLSIIEAFAAGLAVITTDAGGIPYLVTDERTGLLVRCGDEAGLAQSVLRLLADDALAQRLIHTARAECVKYTWEAVREQWLAAYAALSPGRVSVPLALFHHQSPSSEAQAEQSH